LSRREISCSFLLHIFPIPSCFGVDIQILRITCTVANDHQDSLNFKLTRENSRAKTFPTLGASAWLALFFKKGRSSSCEPLCGPPLLLRVNLAVDFEPARHLPRHLPHVAGVTAWCSRLRRVLKYPQKRARTLLRILWFKLVEPPSREYISNLFSLLLTLIHVFSRSARF